MNKYRINPQSYDNALIHYEVQKEYIQHNLFGKEICWSYVTTRNTRQEAEDYIFKILKLEKKLIIERKLEEGITYG